MLNISGFESNTNTHLNSLLNLRDLAVSLKLTCRHINCRHICFNIKSIHVHSLLWMNAMLDFICMVFAEMWTMFYMAMTIYNIYYFLFIIVYIVCVCIYLLILYVGFG